MAEALRIKVDKNTYQQTLNKLQLELNTLIGYQNSLQDKIERLKSGSVFKGSDVRAAITKAEEALETVKDAISRVTGYREAINQQLLGVESAATQLQRDMSDIDLPNMFS